MVVGKEMYLFRNVNFMSLMSDVAKHNDFKKESGM